MSGNVGIDNLDSEFQITRDKDGAVVIRGNTTVTNASIAFLPRDLNSATTHVLWQVNDADIRVEFDGNDATATTGVILFDKASTIWSRSLAESAKAFRNDATDAIITVYELQKGSPQKEVS